MTKKQKDGVIEALETAAKVIRKERGGSAVAEEALRSMGELARQIANETRNEADAEVASELGG